MLSNGIHNGATTLGVVAGTATDTRFAWGFSPCGISSVSALVKSGVQILILGCTRFDFLYREQLEYRDGI